MTAKLKNLISAADLSAEHVKILFDLTDKYKNYLAESKTRGIPIEVEPLRDRTLALIFEKPSLRTRVTFMVGMAQLGGLAIDIRAEQVLQGRETIADVSRNLDRWVDALVARTFKHRTVLELAKYARIPVINALSDLEHPCQVLADFYTIRQIKGENWKEIKLVYIGDGNNVCHSLLLLTANLGGQMTVATPPKYDPKDSILRIAKKKAQATGATLKFTHDVKEAVKGADFVYTDVWTSMGFEAEREQRRTAFGPFQVNEALMSLAKPDAKFLHCLPAKRGEEVVDGVIDGPHSAVFDQAENRLHVQKALLVHLLT
ncbi:MAG: ornithine carbamoyltransferase [bacterium]